MRNYNTLAELQEDIGGVENSRGRPEPNWKTHGRAWGLMQNTGIAELREFQQRHPTATYRFETHFQPGHRLKPGWSLQLMDGRRLYVIHVENTENRNRTWEIALGEDVTVEP